MKNSPNELFVGCGHGISSSNMVGHFLSLEETIDGEWHRVWHEGPYFFGRFQGTSEYNRHGWFLGTNVIWVNQGEARMRSPLDACLFLWSRVCPFMILIFFVLVIIWLIMPTQDIVSHLVRNLSFIATICLGGNKQSWISSFPPVMNISVSLGHKHLLLLLFCNNSTAGQGWNYSQRHTQRHGSKPPELFHVYWLKWVNKHDLIESLWSNYKSNLLF